MDLVERLVVAEPPLSTAQKVLVVAEGGTFRARLDGDGPNLGLTLKATRDGRAVVQALPAPSRARAAGVRIGDEVLGVDGVAFERGGGEGRVGFQNFLPARNQAQRLAKCN